MTRARFVVTLPDGSWLGALSREFPEATFSVLTAIRGEGASYGLLWIAAPDLDPVLDAVTGADGVLESVLHRTVREAAIAFETRALPLFDHAAEAGVPVDTPVAVADGVATLDVVGLPRRITALGEVFDGMAIDYTIAHIRDELPVRERLTQKQRRLVARAIEMGYYDTPRACSLTDLAESMDLAKSTISETLHRAEEVLIKEALKTAVGGGDTAEVL